MTARGRVRVFMACSLDGFIAGPGNDLAWLERDHSAPGDLAADADALTFEAFMEDVGALLMGRTTYDVVERMVLERGVPWVYGATPVLVASRRALEPRVGAVRRVAGPIDALVAEARTAADGRDIYVDGGDVIRQALAAGLVDELTLTLVPILLSRGTRLFDGLEAPVPLQFVARTTLGNGLVQLTARRRA